MIRRHLWVLLSLVSFLFSCDAVQEDEGVVDAIDDIYIYYRISGEEGKEKVNCYLQYRYFGSSGFSLLIDKPGFVKLDKEVLKPDSSSFTGIYYETMKPIHEFSGIHTITLKSQKGNEYREKFEFLPFSIKDSLPKIVKRNDLVIELAGLKPVDYIRVIATDTSFNSADINKLDTVQDGKLIISKERLNKVVNGPINFQLIKEVDRPLSDPTASGGRISISYGLKRNFTLVN